MRLVCLFLSLSFSFLLYAHTDDSFSTRLRPDLAISGYRCSGGETTAGAVFEGPITYVCSKNEWLLYVDNLNRCHDDLCTELAVTPVIVKLNKPLLSSDSEYEIFNLSPVIPVAAEVRWILRRHQVRFNINGEGEVVRK